MLSVHGDSGAVPEVHACAARFYTGRANFRRPQLVCKHAFKAWVAGSIKHLAAGIVLCNECSLRAPATHMAACAAGHAVPCSGTGSQCKPDTALPWQPTTLLHMAAAKIPALWMSSTQVQSLTCERLQVGGDR